MKKAKVMFLLAAVITMAFAFTAAVHASDDKVYDDLSVTGKGFYSSTKNDLGNIPVIKGMDALNKEIENIVQNEYWYMPNYNSIDFTSDRFLCSYTVEDSKKTNPDGANQYAKVTVTLRKFIQSNLAAKADSFIADFYINKDGMKKISKDDYDKGVKAEGEAKEEAAVVDDVAGTMALKANVVLLGYEYAFDTSSLAITISNADGVVAELTLDVNEYPGGIELSAAPVLENGVIVVPVSFFTSVLGVEVVEIDGSFVVAVE